MCIHIKDRASGVSRFFPILSAKLSQHQKMQEDDSDSNSEDVDGQGDGGDDNESSEESDGESNDEVQETEAKTEPGKHEAVGERGTMGDTGTPSNNVQKKVEAQVLEAKVVVAAESQKPDDTPNTTVTAKTHEKLDTKPVPGVSVCSPKPEHDIAKTQQGTTPSAPEEKGKADGQGKGCSFVSNKNENYVIIYILYQFFMCVAKFILPTQR